MSGAAIKLLLIFGLGIIVLVGVMVLPAVSSGSSCGDWDRADAEDLLEGSRIERGNDGVSYEHDPGDGDYRKTGPGEFEYVGCDGGSRSHGSTGHSSSHGSGHSRNSGSTGHSRNSGSTGHSRNSGSSGYSDSGSSGGSSWRGGGPGFGK
ncbi:hypothetical protein [Streptomonospora sediminis]